MLGRTTSFAAAVRTLKSPTSAAFDVNLWKAAYDSASGDKTPEDTRLMMSALWIFAQSEMLRSSFANLPPAWANAGTWTVLALAATNREFRTGLELQADDWSSRDKQTPISLGETRILSDQSGRKVTIDGLTESVVDLVENWIFDAAALPTTGTSQPPPDISGACIGAIQKYSIQRQLNVMWNQAYWEGWQFDAMNSKPCWQPSDRHFATLIEANLVRHEENMGNIPLIDFASWPTMTPKMRQAHSLPRTVTEVSSRGRHRTIRIGKPQCRSHIPSRYVTDKAALEGSYLAPFLDRILPKVAPLTAKLLLQAWHVIADLAASMKPPLPVGELAAKEARDLALTVSRSELLDILQRALDLDVDTGLAVIDFLTFQAKRGTAKGHRGLWTAPLVAIPSEENFGLSYGALLASSPLRKVEAWLEKGGLDDSLARSARGGDYETQTRTELRELIERNQLLPTSRCAEHSIKKGEFPEEIDILIKLGNILIVGEVKCWLFPADPFERQEYFGKLRKAALQATRKAAALDKRRDVAANALCLPIEQLQNLRIIPLVVTNQGFGMSLEVEECRVTDRTFLANYLSAGAIISGVIFEPKSGQRRQLRTVFYQNEKEASAHFEDTIAMPSVLQRFYDRIDWQPMTFPIFGGEPVFCLQPILTEAVTSRRLAPPTGIARR